MRYSRAQKARRPAVGSIWETADKHHHLPNLKILYYKTLAVAAASVKYFIMLDLKAYLLYNNFTCYCTTRLHIITALRGKFKKYLH